MAFQDRRSFAGMMPQNPSQAPQLRKLRKLSSELNKNSTNPSFQSQRAKINALLRYKAKKQGASVNDLRKQYIFSLFLRRIFSAPDGQWLLLGGNALIMRTGGEDTRKTSISHVQNRSIAKKPSNKSSRSWLIALPSEILFDSRFSPSKFAHIR